MQTVGHHQILTNVSGNYRRDELLEREKRQKFEFLFVRMKGQIQKRKKGSGRKFGKGKGEIEFHRSEARIDFK